MSDIRICIPRLASAIALGVSLCSIPAHAQQTPGAAVPDPQQAPIALLVDISNGQVLHARDPDRRFIPASITKVMTLFLAFELIEEGALDPAQLMTMRSDSWREWGGKGSTMWINAGDRLRVRELLTGIANVSANDASIMLAEGYAGSVAEWVEQMNAAAQGIGMAQSHFGTPNGWPDEGQTFTTASDLILLGSAMVREHPGLFRQFVGLPGYTYGGITQPNHDPLIGRVAGADGIKTGYTNESGFGYLGTVLRDGQRLMMVVAGSERGGVRARAAREYVEWGFAAFERRMLFEAQTAIAQARVQGGDQRMVDLIAKDDVWINLLKGSAQEPVISIDYSGPLEAPISDGEAVADLVIELDGSEAVRLPLYARQEVQSAGFFDRIWNGIAGWFS